MERFGRAVGGIFRGQVRKGGRVDLEFGVEELEEQAFFRWVQRAVAGEDGRRELESRHFALRGEKRAAKIEDITRVADPAERPAPVKQRRKKISEKSVSLHVPSPNQDWMISQLDLDEACGIRNAKSETLEFLRKKIARQPIMIE